MSSIWTNKRPSAVAVLALAASAIALTACSSSGSGSNTSNSPPGGSTAANSAASGSASAGSSIPAGPIKVGIIVSKSGPFGPYGELIAGLYATEIKTVNAAGGVDGHQLDLISLDDKGDSATSVAQANKLVSEKVIAVLNPSQLFSAQTIPIFAKAHIPMVTVNPDPTLLNASKYPGYFTTYPSAEQVAVSTVAFLKAKGGKIGILSDGPTFGATNVPYVTSAAKSAGVDITDTVTYAPTATDVSTQLRELKSSGAKTLAVEAVANLPAVWAGLRQIGWSPITVAPAAAYSSGYSDIKTLAPTTFAACTVSLAPGTTPSAALVTQLKPFAANFGNTPSVASSLHYADAVNIIAYAIGKANSIDGTDIIKAISAIRDQSFAVPDYKYNFTTPGGWLQQNTYVCTTTGLGPYSLPYRAAS